jgi:hypothetical protein
MVSINCFMFCHSEGDEHLDWRVGLVLISLNRHPEGDIPDLKHVAVDTMNYILWFVFYCILLSVFVDCYSEYISTLSSSLHRLLMCLAHGKQHKAVIATT